MGTNIGRALRVMREHRGWSRETLAHHAGVSWAAIAQIEAGRRPDPRLSTLMALAEPLGVTVDQLTGRAPPAEGPPSLLEHGVLTYTTDAEFLDAAVPFLRAGIERSESVLAITVGSRIRRLRRALGPDAPRVLFRESSVWCSSPSASLAGYRSFLHERMRDGPGWVRIVADPVWTGGTEAENRAWIRYESMVNLSLAASPATIMCTYGTRTVSPSIVADAPCTHPHVHVGADSVASPEYRPPHALLLER